MRRGEEVQTRSDPKVEIQERGEIYFFYRPKVSREEAHSADDVQRLYIVLRPESGEKAVEEKQSPDSGKEGASKSSKKAAKAESKETEGGHGSKEVNIEKQPLLRFTVMGRKSLPDLRKRGTPYWGFVEMVTTKTDDIKAALRGDEYDTATRGHRHKPPARPLGEGVYQILRHYQGSGRRIHTHLIYKLEFPPKDAENTPQESLNIKHEGSFIIQIRNPEHKGGLDPFGFHGLQHKRKAVFPSHLQGQLGQLRFTPADPPDFLNYEGCEFLLISASDDIDEELGLDIRTHGEECNESCSNLIQMFGGTAPIDPLIKGVWA